VANGRLPISAAVEGDVDEAVLRRIVEHIGLELGNVYGREGKQRLLRRLGGYNNAARVSPWVVLVDLDGDFGCAPAFVQHWLAAPSQYMRFRVVVQAIEAWLMADRQRISAALAINERRLPLDPDSVPQPKAVLVDLARHSKSRAIREEMVPRERSGRSVGPLYGARLRQFVLDEASGWRPDEAAAHSNSLRRCMESLRRFAQ